MPSQIFVDRHSARNHVEFTRVHVPNDSSGTSRWWVSKVDRLYWVCIGICGSAWFLWLGLVQWTTNETITSLVTIQNASVMEFCGPNLTWANLVENSWWPGCGFTRHDTDWSTCGTPCMDADFMHEMIEFNRRQPATLVSYKSRQAPNVPLQVTLRGWWLPSPQTASAQPNPRIVLQHGTFSNSNKYRTQMAAYMLRAMGFDVLVNNFRDHCYSDDTGHNVVSWGHAYPHDLLGAWDYARRDPHGILGGAVGPGQVGIMGFSMGGFTTLNVFGLDGAVPGVWVDGPPLSPKSAWMYGFRQRFDSMNIGWLADVVAGPVWSNVEQHTSLYSIDISENTPSRVLPAGPNTRRPIFCAANINDQTVPFADHLELIRLLEQYPEKYYIEGTLESSEDCNGEHHCADHLRMPREYGRLLCEFWSDVFGTSEARCGLASLTTWRNGQNVTLRRRLEFTNGIWV